MTVVAAVVRFHDYTVAPPPSLDGDEMAWTWAGQSLIEHGRPTSWTSLPGYTNLRYEKTQIGTLPIVTPWLDEPPVFALLEGASVIVAGETTPQEANVSAARVPVILLSLTSLVLAALLLLRLFGAGVALLGAALLALSPAITEASRTVESEALLMSAVRQKRPPAVR
ncbi:MAG: glycosyltransferase family 39 protein [Candidatus Dormibacteria bacterium]